MFTFKEYLMLDEAQLDEMRTNMPAINDREMMSKGMRDRTGNNNSAIRSGKRNAQMAGRNQRRMHGKGTGGRNYMDNLFGKGGRPEHYEEEENKMSPMEKNGYEDGRSGVKFTYDQSPAYNRGYEKGENHAKSYEDEMETKYDNVVIEPNHNRGRGVIVYGYTRNNGQVQKTVLDDFNSLKDAKNKYPMASSTASHEDEMEHKVHADFDRSKQFNNEVSKLGDKSYQDILHSEPSMKRMKQKFARNRRRSWGRCGREDEMEINMPLEKLRKRRFKDHLTSGTTKGDPEGMPVAGGYPQ